MYSAGFEHNPVLDVPEDQQRKVAGLCLELQQQDLYDAQSLSKSLKTLDEEFQMKLHKLIGDRNLEPYIEHRLKIREQMRDRIKKATPTADNEIALDKERVKIVKESLSYLKELGIDKNSADKLRDEYNNRIRDTLRTARKIEETEPNFLILPEDVPDYVHNPWAIYQPPYPGYAWSYSWNRSDEPNTPSFARYLNAASGQLGTYTRTRVSGADDSDYSNVTYRTAMRFWYQIPVAGMAEIYMDMQCIDTPYTGHLHDEWGFSGATCDQESHSYLRVISPGPGAFRRGNILDYRRNGTSANWDRDVTAAGNHRWAHLFSSDAYEAGTWLLLEVGTEEWNHFWCNDVSVTSTMTMRWFLERVYVRSSGE